jgi:hypothetical protein
MHRWGGVSVRWRLPTMNHTIITSTITVMVLIEG